MSGARVFLVREPPLPVTGAGGSTVEVIHKILRLCSSLKLRTTDITHNVRKTLSPNDFGAKFERLWYIFSF